MKNVSLITTLLTAATLLNTTPSAAASTALDPTTAIINFNSDFDTKYGDMFTPSTVSKGSTIMNPQYLTQIQNLNHSASQASTFNTTSNATGNNISNSLTQFNYALNRSYSSTPDPLELKFTALVQKAPGQFQSIAFKDYSADNEPEKLINGSKNVADDNLYLNNAEADKASIANQSKIKKPNTTASSTPNAFLNFANLFETTVFKTQKNANGEASNPEFDAAKKYVVFAAQSTKNLAEGLNLSALKTHPNKLAQFKSSPDYLKFAMTIRSLVAIRSITIDTLEHLIAERTPQPNQGVNIGNPNGDKSASPLQIEQYQANHRIEDPKWYHSIMNDAPITLQRTIAIELAEIEHQNYQAHIDRERILAALTAANLQSNSSSNVMLKEQINTLNSDISSSTAPKKTPSVPTH